MACVVAVPHSAMAVGAGWGQACACSRGVKVPTVASWRTPGRGRYGRHGVADGGAVTARCCGRLGAAAAGYVRGGNALHGAGAAGFSVLRAAVW